MLATLTPPLIWADRQWRRLREPVARALHPTPVSAVALRCPLTDVPLPARLHPPRGGEGPWPGVLLVPGGLDGAASLEGRSCVLTAPALARWGFATLVFTPTGREGLPGEEDRNGPVHQAQAAAALAALLAHPAVDPARVAVVSISFGLAMAAGMLAGQPALAARVAVLLDWEGPGSRAWLSPSKLGMHLHDAAYWAPREAVHHVGRLACPYHRFQSRWDHVHGPQPEIGRALVRAAWAGTCPQVGWNGRWVAPGADLDAPLPGVRWGAQVAVLRAVLQAALRPHRGPAQRGVST